MRPFYWAIALTVYVGLGIGTADSARTATLAKCWMPLSTPNHVNLWPLNLAAIAYTESRCLTGTSFHELATARRLLDSSFVHGATAERICRLASPILAKTELCQRWRRLRFNQTGVNL